MTNNSTQHIYEKRLDVSFILPTCWGRLGHHQRKSVKSEVDILKI